MQVRPNSNPNGPPYIRSAPGDVLSPTPPSRNSKGLLAAIGGVLGIIVALIAILQFVGIARLQCIWSDCSGVVSTSTPAPINSPVPTNTPDLRPLVVNDNDPSIVYEGNWSYFENTCGPLQFVGCDHHVASGIGNSFSHSFIGIRVSIVSIANPPNGRLDCSVDGHLKRSINLSSDQPIHLVEEPVADNLTYGAHTLSCVITSPPGENVDLDAIKIN
jgi:hypothetical protein